MLRSILASPQRPAVVLCIATTLLGACASTGHSGLPHGGVTATTLVQAVQELGGPGWRVQWPVSGKSQVGLECTTDGNSGSRLLDAGHVATYQSFGDLTVTYVSQHALMADFGWLFVGSASGEWGSGIALDVTLSNVMLRGASDSAMVDFGSPLIGMRDDFASGQVFSTFKDELVAETVTFDGKSARALGVTLQIGVEALDESISVNFDEGTGEVSIVSGLGSGLVFGVNPRTLRLVHEVLVRTTGSEVSGGAYTVAVCPPEGTGDVPVSNLAETVEGPTVEVTRLGRDTQRFEAVAYGRPVIIDEGPGTMTYVKIWPVRPGEPTSSAEKESRLAIDVGSFRWELGRYSTRWQ